MLYTVWSIFPLWGALLIQCPLHSCYFTTDIKFFACNVDISDIIINVGPLCLFCLNNIYYPVQNTCACPVARISAVHLNRVQSVEKKYRVKQ